MADTADLHQDMGSVKAQLETLNREMRDVKNDVRQIRDDFSQVKGGWRTLIGIAAIIGGGISWAVNYFIGKH
jgi:chromosome condensin MukBEF ATPase and DNA-binding subunit MukB